MPGAAAKVALYRRKMGALLLAVQIAITLAIVANSINFVAERLRWSSQRTGIDEANVLYIYIEDSGNDVTQTGREMSDLNKLRTLPGVVDAYATNSYPLEGGGWSVGVDLAPNQSTPSAKSAYYYGDDHALRTLGLTLLQGRNFSPDEVVDRDSTTAPAIGVVVVTHALALALFPGGNALGKPIYVETSDPVTIIGIVDRLQGPFVAATESVSSYRENCILAPFRPLGLSSTYVVRAATGRLAEIAATARNDLMGLGGYRDISIKTMEQVRSEAYRSNRGLILLLGLVALTLVIVTTFGITGLSSYWVVQRRRQIGIRRALGATRVQIIRQFQSELLRISSTGVVAGVALAEALNVWLASHFQMKALSIIGLATEAAAVIVLIQLATLGPAIRASRVAPGLAVRDV